MEITLLDKVFLSGVLLAFIGIIGIKISPDDGKTLFYLVLSTIGGLLAMFITILIGIWEIISCC